MRDALDTMKGCDSRRSSLLFSPHLHGLCGAALGSKEMNGPKPSGCPVVRDRHRLHTRAESRAESVARRRVHAADKKQCWTSTRDRPTKVRGSERMKTKKLRSKRTFKRHNDAPPMKAFRPPEKANPMPPVIFRACARLAGYSGQLPSHYIYADHDVAGFAYAQKKCLALNTIDAVEIKR